MFLNFRLSKSNKIFLFKSFICIACLKDLIFSTYKENSQQLKRINSGD